MSARKGRFVDAELYQLGQADQLNQNTPEVDTKRILQAEAVGYDGENISFRDVTDDVLAQVALGSSSGAVSAVEFSNTQTIRFTAESAGKTFVKNPFDGSSKLKPDVLYVSGEFDYLYETDYLGRIERFATDQLLHTKRISRLPHKSNTPGKLPGDHAGHLAADIFGGSPMLDNIISQASDVNLSKYRIIENQWARAIDNGKKVQVDVSVTYDQQGLRPTQFIVRYVIDGKLYRKILNNQE